MSSLLGVIILRSLSLTVLISKTVRKLGVVAGVVCVITFHGISTAAALDQPDIDLYADAAASKVSNDFQPGSHIKLFLPHLPYIAISHAVNAALVRPAPNDRGWQYDLAIKHQNIDDKIWEFELRRDVTFQDGSAFNADSVVSNMMYFKRQPYTFTKLHTILDRVEKVNDYTVRFYLTESYGTFLHDAIWLQFYTPGYLEKFGWNGKPTCPNLAEPGLYGLGPYILLEGYIEGDRRTEKAILKANPDYWGDNKPKVETITVYTEFGLDQAMDAVTNHEGIIDLAPVKFEDLVSTVLAPYSKLASSPSMNSYAMHINFLNGNEALKDDRIRFVINHAIDQEYLLNLAMMGEGVLSPTMISPNFYKASDALALLENYFEDYKKNNKLTTKALRQTVQAYQVERGRNPNKNIELKLLVQKDYLFLIRDVQYFLSQVNISLDLEVVSTEQEVFYQLHGTWKNENEKQWDLLLWGNYDWYKHPWSTFFVYSPFNAWSTIPPNKQLQEFSDQIVRVNTESDRYAPFLAKYIQYLYENNFMVFLPTPNNVYAVNKEVLFSPGPSAFVSLRDLQLTRNHWSLRDHAVTPDSVEVDKVPRKNSQELSE